MINSITTKIANIINNNEIAQEAMKQVEIIKACREAGKNLFKALLTAKRFDVSPKGYDIIQIDELITLNCGLLPTQPGALALRNAKGQECIVVNGACRALPEELFWAIIGHEEGHHVLGHLKTQMEKGHSNLRGLFSRALGGSKSIYVIREYEADAYSAEQGHDMLAVLRLWKQMFPKNKEIEERIRRLS